MGTMRNLILYVIAGIWSCVAGCTSASTPVRFVTFNAANGADDPFYRTAEGRAKQRAFLATLAPDVLALQETDFWTPRVGGVSTAAEIAPPDGQILHGFADACPEGGYYGLALWVSNRITVESWGRVELPRDGSEVWPPYPETKRVAIFARLLLPDGRRVFVGTSHLTAFGAHPAQLRAEQFAVLANSGADVLLGDFNAAPAEAAEILAPKFALAVGMPTDAEERSTASARMAVDQIWARGALEEAENVPTDGASDHLFAAVAVW
jgi:endonuclease/exonuclease/phosphatase family metal-dependent hydrolase